MHEITVKRGEENITIRLREPAFEELSEAFIALTSSKNGLNYAAAGRVLIRTCGDYSLPSMDVILKDPKLEFSAALKAAEIITIYDAELKKN
jgi:hypothetical protein